MQKVTPPRDTLEELGFVKLVNRAIYLYKPSPLRNGNDSAQISSSRPPGLIVLCAWLDAAPKHVAKYVVKHKVLFPSARILLFFNHRENMLWRPDFIQFNRLEPALLAVKDFLAQDMCGDILLHVFSNGGAHSATQLTQAWRQSGASPRHVPIACEILDSCPSIPNYTLSVHAVIQGLPKGFAIRLFMIPITVVLIGFATLLHIVGIARLSVDKMRYALNDPQGSFVTETVKRRIYVYGKGDQMVPWTDVLAHAEEARRVLGKDKVQTEEFVGSKHVAHAVVDGERYWRLITDAWKRSAFE